ncbi:MAG TPA: polysaccharide biosynthesis/export family protein [Candidatus Acidoferrum sp.]|nr:polysaccharide biosynthesis/export family protein [Candidatus Acidoferrum sp.]
MLKANIFVAVLIMVFLMPAFAQQSASSDQEIPSTTSATEASSKKAATVDPNYVIGPQDMLDINVWKEPGVSRTVPVRPDGKISLPLLDDVQAAGLTPMQLSDSLTEKLKKFIAQPEVTVIVTQINSERVYVIGSVARPGAYPLTPGMTILQALSSAGGFTQFANEKKIFLLRTVGGKQAKYFFNYKDVINGKHPDQNLKIDAGDTIVVP